jgi:CHAT domain-containing protein
MKRLLVALLAFAWPMVIAASPAQELAERFIDVLRHDDLSLLAKLVDPNEADPRAWEEFRAAVDRYDCFRIDRYDWSVVSASDDRIAVRMNIELTGELKAAWRPELRLPRTWHIEARRIDGVWRVSRVISEERRLAMAMAAAPSAADAECLAAEARDVDPLMLVTKYAREISDSMNFPRLEHALALAQETGDVSTQVAVLTEYTPGAEKPKMLETALRAEELARTSGTADNLVDARLSLGLAYLLNGDRDRAHETYAAAAEMAGIVDDPTTALKCIQMRSYAGWREGSPIEQLQSAETLLELSRRYEWEEGELLGLFNHQEVHWQLGNLDVVRADCLAIIRLAGQQGNSKFAAYGLVDLAELESRESRYTEAARRFRQAIDLFSDTEVTPGALLDLGRAEIILGHFAEAEESMAKAEAMLPPEHPQQVWILARRSELELARGHADRAVIAAQEGLRKYDAQTEARDPSMRASVLHDLARAHAASGQTGEAVAELRQAIAVIENRQEETGGGPLGRVAFLQDYASIYVELVELLVARNEIEAAFRVAEEMKGQGLREAIAESHIDLSASLSAGERTHEEALQTRIAEINRTLLEAMQKRTPATAIEKQLATARLELNAFRGEIRIKHPELQRRRIDALAGVELPSGSESMALVEYVIGEKELLAFVVRAHAPIRVVRIRVPSKKLRRDVRELENLIAARSPGYRAAARGLYDVLFAPLEPYLRGDTTVAIAPDGLLWTVPFHALVAPDGRHLVDRYAVFYAHSLSLLRSASVLHSAAPSFLLALGNPTVAGSTRSTMRAAFRDAALGPLDDAENEVRALASMYPTGDRHAYYGDAASETMFKDEAPHFRVIHIAAHAIVDDRAPMYSAIALAPGGKKTEDGLLEAREVVDLPLDADLAVLSACQTARGRVGSGEGVIGLSWAFFAAGCPTTVVSQWDAESASTAKLMIEFHRRLRAGESTAKALRGAQLSVRRIAKYRHPFYWAPFVAIGAAGR